MEQTLTDVRARREQVAASSASETVVRCEALSYDTTTAPEFIDITEDVQRVVQDSGVAFGQVTVFSNHTTAAVKINENEPLLLQDMARILEQIAPRGGEYDHNDFERRTVNMEDEECANGHAHCQHLFLSTSETIPIIDGRLMTGQWQRIFLVELDMPRPRRILVNVVGVAS
jgi:secondary thiamine-phosphate synthase enzyme